MNTNTRSRWFIFFALLFLLLAATLLAVKLFWVQPNLSRKPALTSAHQALGIVGGDLVKIENTGFDPQVLSQTQQNIHKVTRFSLGWHKDWIWPKRRLNLDRYFPDSPLPSMGGKLQNDWNSVQHETAQISQMMKARQALEGSIAQLDQQAIVYKTTLDAEGKISLHYKDLAQGLLAQVSRIAETGTQLFRQDDLHADKLQDIHNNVLALKAAKGNLLRESKGKEAVKLKVLTQHLMAVGQSADQLSSQLQVVDKYQAAWQPLLQNWQTLKQDQNNTFLYITQLYEKYRNLAFYSRWVNRGAGLFFSLSILFAVLALIQAFKTWRNSATFHEDNHEKVKNYKEKQQVAHQDRDADIVYQNKLASDTKISLEIAKDVEIDPVHHEKPSDLTTDLKPVILSSSQNAHVILNPSLTKPVDATTVNLAETDIDKVSSEKKLNQFAQTMTLGKSNPIQPQSEVGDPVLKAWLASEQRVARVQEDLGGRIGETAFFVGKSQEKLATLNYLLSQISVLSEQFDILSLNWVIVGEHEQINRQQLWVLGEELRALNKKLASLTQMVKETHKALLQTQAQAQGATNASQQTLAKVRTGTQDLVEAMTAKMHKSESI